MGDTICTFCQGTGEVTQSNAIAWSETGEVISTAQNYVPCTPCGGKGWINCGHR